MKEETCWLQGQLNVQAEKKKWLKSELKEDTQEP